MAAERRFVVCGETLIDLVRDEDRPGDTFSTGWSALSAGSPMNTAVALSMLGADSHFLGRISTDEFGRQLRGHLEKAGVGLDLAVSSDQVTSLAVVSLDERGKASYAFHFDQTANFGWQPDELPALVPEDWMHIGSLALIVPPGAGVLLEWLRSVTAPISIDINVRSSVVTDPADYWHRITGWLQVAGPTGVIKASDDDVRFLAGDWQPAAERWVSDFGLGMVVITRGEDGASALTGDGWTHIPAYPTELVDTVGAGDTFMAGFLDGHVRLSLPLEESLRRGAAAAAIVCARQGAQPPTAAEIEELQARTDL
ncbi:fructokinase [Microlunatus endophyticus]|uniref:Fructokinase n=1 Tax=Microlunatus endophyticus TaxID=1716077 RepID=A0A917S7I2_9ACTN|nr:carbohydrate kinase [Microlunatus endophyticus]GGL62212.1 fructokinase [Microlunatus endophyticus]